MAVVPTQAVFAAALGMGLMAACQTSYKKGGWVGVGGVGLIGYELYKKLKEYWDQASKLPAQAINWLLDAAEKLANELLGMSISKFTDAAKSLIELAREYLFYALTLYIVLRVLRVI